MSDQPASQPARLASHVHSQSVQFTLETMAVHRVRTEQMVTAVRTEMLGVISEITTSVESAERSRARTHVLWCVSAGVITAGMIYGGQAAWSWVPGTVALIWQEVYDGRRALINFLVRAVTAGLAPFTRL